ncbi:hypothetical protein KI387_015212, partial [Taxus chinensis]
YAKRMRRRPSELDAPCACSGSLKYVHIKCLQRWCNEKGDTICEICHQPYKSGYTALPRPALNLRNTDEWDVHVSGEAMMRGTVDADDDDDHSQISSIAAACCRCAALILLTLLLLRHALAMAVAPVDEDSSLLFVLFLLRAAGFFLPCYIMARGMNILARRRQHQEEEEEVMRITSEEVGMLVEAGLGRE